MPKLSQVLKNLFLLLKCIWNDFVYAYGTICVVHNTQNIQSPISAFCGHYCVFYCLFKHLHYDMSSILNCYTSDIALNDAIVHKFVCHNL